MADGEINEAPLPKVNNFASELANWLILTTIVLFLIYGILFLIYEIAIDLTHARWAFIGFLVCCAIDVTIYWVCTFAVQDESAEENFLLYLVLVFQIVTGFYYIISSTILLFTFTINPAISVTAKDKTKMNGESTREKELDYEEQFYHTFDDYVAPNPCQNESFTSEYAWQCNYEKSVRVAAWCMLIPVLPKLLLGYLLVRIARKRKSSTIV